jgi:hypothetical protein
MAESDVTVSRVPAGTENLLGVYINQNDFRSVHVDGSRRSNYCWLTSVIVKDSMLQELSKPT